VEFHSRDKQVSGVTGQGARGDLDSRAAIGRFVELFYRRLLADERLAPIFVDVAELDLAEHLPRIEDYWCKLLLGEQGYRRHTMAIHRQLHGRRLLAAEDFERWLEVFSTTVDRHFAGERAERAKQVAAAIAANMQKGLGAATPGDKGGP
jgi:hemoglobin